MGFGDNADSVWRYRVLFGWEMRAFRASEFSTHQAPIAELALIWSPSGMTTLTATVTRSIEDAAQEGIAGYTYSRARVVIDHEYLRNVLLQASASVQYRELPAGGRTRGVVVAGRRSHLADQPPYAAVGDVQTSPISTAAVRRPCRPLATIREASAC